MSILKKCRVCESSNLEEIIDFGKQPWCNDFLNYEIIQDIICKKGVICKNGLNIYLFIKNKKTIQKLRL